MWENGSFVKKICTMLTFDGASSLVAGPLLEHAVNLLLHVCPVLEL